MTMNSGTFKPGHVHTKTRGKDKRKMLIDAIKAETGLNEEQFYQELVKQSYWPGMEFLKKEILARLYVPYKATLPAIELDIPDGATLEQKMEIILAAISDGSVTPDVGALLLQMLKTVVEITEKTEMAKRVEAIEAMLKGQPSD